MNLYKGAFIITLGIIISKALSIVFIFPFSNMVGASGVALYSYAYVPYTIFLDIASLGIPQGVSKLVAKYEKSKRIKINHIFYSGLLSIIFLGIISFFLLNLFARGYALRVLGGNQQLENDINSIETVIRIVSLSLLVVPVISLLRGFMQGLSNMKPTAISQIVEQLIRVLMILVSTYLIMIKGDKDYVKCVYIAVFASFVSSIGALLCLLYFMPKVKYDGFKNKVIVFKELFSYAVPFLFLGISFSIYQFIDSITFNRGLLEYGISNPESYYGVYAFEVQKLIALPVAFFTGLSISILPEITRKKEVEDNVMIKKGVTSSISLGILFSIPVLVIVLFYAPNIYRIFYSNYDIGTIILRTNIFIFPLLGLSSLLVSILEGIGKIKILLLIQFMSLIIKILINVYFIKDIGFIGATLGSVIALLFSIALYLHTLKRIKLINMKVLVKRSIIYLVVGLVSTAFIYTSGKLYEETSFDRVQNILFIGFNSVIYLGAFLFFFYFQKKKFE